MYSFQYFWLNYCNENHHIERISVGVKNVDHLFRMASEIIKADNQVKNYKISTNPFLSSTYLSLVQSVIFICFYFLTAPALIIMNT